MTFLSMDDPEFWGRYPENLKPLLEAGLSGFSYFPLGEPSDNPPTVLALRMEPNFVTARHAHDCHRFEIVVQGTLDVGERILKPGDVMFTEPGVAYGPHKAGQEGCTTFEIFTNYRASHVTLIDGPDGMTECDIARPDGLQKMIELMAEAASSS